MTCIGYGVRFADNRCTTPETESNYFYGLLGYRSLKANRVRSFVIVKTIQETKGKAYAFKRTIKEMLTTLFEGFSDFFYEENRADERNVRKNLHSPGFRSARSCVADSSEDWATSAGFLESEEALDSVGATSVPNYA
ncbi:hypothetical protein MRX96_010441 [Rhipicephalus microplus]